MNRQEIITYQKENGHAQAYAWPGGYPLVYLDPSNSMLCPNCAEKLIATWIAQGEKEPGTDEDYDRLEALDLPWEHSSFVPNSCFIYWEGSPIFCKDCNEEIESAYGDPEDEL